MSLSKEDLKKLMREVVSEVSQEHAVQPSREDIVKGNVGIVCKDGACWYGVVEEMKKADYVCEDCGLPLGSEKMVEEMEDCPNCHSHNAKRREEDEE